MNRSNLSQRQFVITRTPLTNSSSHFITNLIVIIAIVVLVVVVAAKVEVVVVVAAIVVMTTVGNLLVHESGNTISTNQNLVSHLILAASQGESIKITKKTKYNLILIEAR